MELNDLTMTNFVGAVAGSDPVPGGGSVSALCAALAAALGRMVAGLTIGKKKYADVQDEMQKIAEKLAPASSLMLNAVDLDSEAYDEVFQAYKFPKDTDDDKTRRSDAIQTALRHAASVPFSVAKLVATFLPDLVTVAEKGNQNAITDAYVAALCARTAVLGAGANARINLASIKDEAFVDEMKRDLDVIEKEAGETERRVADLLQKALA